MRRLIAHAVAALLLPLAVPPAGIAQPATERSAELERCEKLRDRIERYGDLRRRGGSGSQMDRWKRALREAEAEFREKGCEEYRRELR